jgi:hypothetical protein
MNYTTTKTRDGILVQDDARQIVALISDSIPVETLIEILRNLPPVAREVEDPSQLILFPA